MTYPLLAYKDNISYSADKIAAYKAIDNTLFSSKCPYCRLRCYTTTGDNAYDSSGQKDEVAVCTRCGWWSFSSYCWDLNEELHYFSAKAILQEFTVDDKSTPLYELSKYISRNPDKLNNIHPVKFEELVASVYRDVSGFAIESCSYGRPDRGIDVVCMRNETDELYAIQVKRYRRPIELGMIHQFAGAMIDGSFKKGIFITSSKYRSGCFKVARNIEKNSELEIDLVDGRRFLEFLGTFNNKQNSVIVPYWRRYYLFDQFPPPDGGKVVLPKSTI